MDYLARQVPSWHDQVRLIDATPLPCGTSRETVKRSELAGWANYGYCAAHSRWYWGLKLYLITTPDGMPVAWCLASPKIGEREVAASLLSHAARTGALRPALTLIGDKGFAGHEFEDLVTGGFGLRLVRPDRRDEAARHGSIGWIRQWVESVNDTLNASVAHCAFFSSGVLEWSSVGGLYLDAQAAAASAADVHGGQFAALDLMQNGLPGDAEGGGGLPQW
jgi:hypothetical protein